MKPVGIIGGGLAGLAAACVLAARGCKVILFERNDWLGGKAAVLHRRRLPLRHGADHPDRCRRCCAASSPRPARGSRITSTSCRLDPQWRCFFDDGSVARPRAESPTRWPADARRVRARHEPGDGYRRFHRLSRAADGISAALFLLASRSSGLRDMFDFEADIRPEDAARRAGDAHGPLRRVAPIRASSRRPARRADARPFHAVCRLLARMARPPCSAASRTCRPAKASGIRCGGTRAVPEALHAAGARNWASRCAPTPAIARIRRAGRARSTGVETDAGETIAASRRRVEHGLACGPIASWSAAPRRPQLRRRRGATSRPARASCSISGSTKRYEHLAHHDFVFSRDPHEEFDSIYDTRRAGARTRPATSPRRRAPSPSVAPPGGEALYVLVHTPYLRPHHDWNDDAARAIGASILDKLKRTAGLHDLEEPHRVRAHADAAGHPRPLPRPERRDLRAGEPRQASSAPSSRATAARTSRGLYLAGGAAHPGPGMPMVLMSGWIAADALDQDARAGAASPVASSRELEVAR